MQASTSPDGSLNLRLETAEAEKLAGEFEAILTYVGEVKKIAPGADAGQKPAELALKNVLREDANPHESGIYTEAVLANAPAREGEYVKVKKIL